MDDELGGPYHEDILSYNPDANDWETLEQKLEKPDLVTLALVVGENVVSCKPSKHIEQALKLLD